jgi:hypothetical protein
MREDYEQGLAAPFYNSRQSSFLIASNQRQKAGITR